MTLLPHKNPISTFYHPFPHFHLLPPFKISETLENWKISLSLPSNVSKAEVAAVINRSNNKDLVISRSDKWNGVVLLNVMTMLQRWKPS